MNEPFLTSSVIVHFLTGDNLKQQEQAKNLFERIERNELKVNVPISAIADSIVLLSAAQGYNLPHAEIGSLLHPLLRLSGLRIRNRAILTQALELYVSSNLDFTDALIVSEMQQQHATLVYSFDPQLSAVKSITPQEPT